MAKRGILLLKRVLNKAAVRCKPYSIDKTPSKRDATSIRASREYHLSGLDDELLPQRQPACTLLGKLPPEIRALIWSEMRNVDLEFEIEDDKLRLTRDCRKQQLVSILFVCRQSYLETVGIIHTKCTFHFANANSFVKLQEAMSPRRLNSLKNIHLNWPLSELPKFNETVPRYYQSNLPRPARPRLWQLDKLWRSVWQNLSTMKGLTRLYVNLDVPELWKDFWDRHEVDMLRSIPKIKVSDFVLSIPWDHDEAHPRLEESETKMLSYRIVRNS